MNTDDSKSLSAEEDDIHLFRRMMHGVTPLKSTAQRTKRPSPSHSITPQTHLDLTANTWQPLSTHLNLELHAESLMSYGQDRIAPRQFQRLKQGQVHIEARIDLHGFSLAHARDQCAHFIQKHSQQGTRCILIIHGKGGQHSEYSLLKSHVNHWLTQLPTVLAFHSARPQHGGRGAVYVLLKKSSR